MDLLILYLCFCLIEQTGSTGQRAQSQAFIGGDRGLLRRFSILNFISYATDAAPLCPTDSR